MTEAAATAFPVDFTHASFIPLIVGVQRRSVVVFARRLAPFLFRIRYRIQPNADEEKLSKSNVQIEKSKYSSWWHVRMGAVVSTFVASNVFSCKLIFG